MLAFLLQLFSASCLYNGMVRLYIQEVRGTGACKIEEGVERSKERSYGPNLCGQADVEQPPGEPQNLREEKSVEQCKLHPDRSCLSRLCESRDNRAAKEGIGGYFKRPGEK